MVLVHAFAEARLSAQCDSLPGAEWRLNCELDAKGENVDGCDQGHYLRAMYWQTGGNENSSQGVLSPDGLKWQYDAAEVGWKHLAPGGGWSIYREATDEAHTGPLGAHQSYSSSTANPVQFAGGDACDDLGLHVGSDARLLSDKLKLSACIQSACNNSVCASVPDRAEVRIVVRRSNANARTRNTGAVGPGNDLAVDSNGNLVFYWKKRRNEAKDFTFSASDFEHDGKWKWRGCPPGSYPCPAEDAGNSISSLQLKFYYPRTRLPGHLLADMPGAAPTRGCGYSGLVGPLPGPSLYINEANEPSEVLVGCPAEAGSILFYNLRTRKIDVQSAYIEAPSDVGSTGSFWERMLVEKNPEERSPGGDVVGAAGRIFSGCAISNGVVVVLPRRGYRMLVVKADPPVATYLLTLNPPGLRSEAYVEEGPGFSGALTVTGHTQLLVVEGGLDGAGLKTVSYSDATRVMGAPTEGDVAVWGIPGDGLRVLRQGGASLAAVQTAIAEANPSMRSQLESHLQNNAVWIDLPAGAEARHPLDEKWSGGVYSPDSGLIYAIPASSDFVLAIDPVTNEVNDTAIAVPAEVRGVARKWSGGVLANNGYIYCIPSDAESVLIIKPQKCLVPGMAWDYPAGSKGDRRHPSFGWNCRVDKAGTAEAHSVRVPAGLGKWSGGVYLPTLNRIVGCPHSSTDVLVIEPEDGVTSTGDHVYYFAYNEDGSYTGSVGDYAWSGGAIVGDSTVFCAPRTAEFMLRVNLGNNVLDHVDPTIPLSQSETYALVE